MLKRVVIRLLPLLKPNKFSILNYSNYTLPPTHGFKLFSNQKENHEGKTSTQKEQKASTQKEQKVSTQKGSKDEKGSKTQEAEKAANVEAQNNQSKISKLRKLSNEQLIELNTQESLKIVRINLENMMNLKQKQKMQIQAWNQQIQYLSKLYSESTSKEEMLLQNIKAQQEELKRIKIRADKQIEDSKDYGITKIAKQLLQFSDSLKNCKKMVQQLKIEGEDKYSKKIIEINDEFRKFLKLYDIEEFDPINQPFDPNTSEGLLTIPTPQGYQKNNVGITMMTGYKIKSRLLRSAKVGIFV